MSGLRHTLRFVEFGMQLQGRAEEKNDGTATVWVCGDHVAWAQQLTAGVAGHHV